MASTERPTHGVDPVWVWSGQRCGCSSHDAPSVGVSALSNAHAHTHTHCHQCNSSGRSHDGVIWRVPPSDGGIHSFADSGVRCFLRDLLLCKLARWGLSRLRSLMPPRIPVHKALPVQVWSARRRGCSLRSALPVGARRFSETRTSTLALV